MASSSGVGVSGGVPYVVPTSQIDDRLAHEVKRTPPPSLPNKVERVSDRTLIVEYLAHLPTAIVPSVHARLHERREAWWRLKCPQWKHTLSLTLTVTSQRKGAYHLDVHVANGDVDHKTLEASDERKVWRKVVESHGLYDESSSNLDDRLMCQAVPAEKAAEAIRDILLLISVGSVEGDSSAVALAVDINPFLRTTSASVAPKSVPNMSF